MIALNSVSAVTGECAAPRRRRGDDAFDGDDVVQRNIGDGDFEGGAVPGEWARPCESEASEEFSEAQRIDSVSDEKAVGWFRFRWN